MKATGTILSRGTVYFAIQTGAYPWLGVDSVEEVLTCSNSNESYWSVLSCGDVHCALQSGSVTFESMDEVLSCANWNESFWSGFSVVVLFIILYKVVLTDLSVHEILMRSKGRTYPKVHISYLNISSLYIRWGIPCQQKTRLTCFCPICVVCVFPTNDVNRQVSDCLNWRLYFERDLAVRTSTMCCLHFDREIVRVTTRES